jgi:hypothetical protein
MGDDEGQIVGEEAEIDLKAWVFQGQSRNNERRP